MTISVCKTWAINKISLIRFIGVLLVSAVASISVVVIAQESTLEIVPEVSVFGSRQREYLLEGTSSLGEDSYSANKIIQQARISSEEVNFNSLAKKIHKPFKGISHA